MRRWTWLLPFALAAAISFLSHRPALPFGLQLPQPLDKLAHAAAFAALAAAAEFAWSRSGRGSPLHRRQLGVLLAACAFGAIDEWHQSFVPGRDASLGDWAADALGAMAGLAAMALPALRGRAIQAAWAGYVDTTPDGVPGIGELAAIPGFVLAAGFSGHGFGIGPGAGHLIADLVTGAPPIVDPRPLHPGRLAQSAWGKVSEF